MERLNLLHPQGCAPWLVGSSIAQIVVHPETALTVTPKGVAVFVCGWKQEAKKKKRRKGVDRGAGRGVVVAAPTV